MNVVKDDKIINIDNEKSRIYFFDNLKAVLIFLVVFGHVIEPIAVNINKVIYIYIYLFHMPLFVFCSGYLAKSNPLKLLTNMVYPYVIFQFVYIILNNLIKSADMPLQFVKPYWFMWYLMAMVVWNLILPIIEMFLCKKSSMMIALGLSIVISLLAGYATSIGAFLSFSRIIYFLPFFIVGVIIKKMDWLEKLKSEVSKTRVRILLITVNFVVLIGIYIEQYSINLRWLYGSSSYSAILGYNIYTRIYLYFLAIITSLLIISFIPNKKIIISKIGQRSMSVYLLHGVFIIIYTKYIDLSFAKNRFLSILFSVIFSVFIVLLLSSSIIQKSLSPLFSFPYKFNKNK